MFEDASPIVFVNEHSFYILSVVQQATVAVVATVVAAAMVAVVAAMVVVEVGTE
jgi:hypothetical protein